jgi:multiple sugar transport system permease protein
MIPQFLLMNDLGLNNTHWAIICLQAFTPFGVFLLTQFFKGIPAELIEAAKIDGARYTQIYVRIILPMGKPAISSLAIITFIFSMNDFLGPFLYLDKERLRTITLGIRWLAFEYFSHYAMQMAGTVLALIPMLVIYVIAQKQIIKGIAFRGGGSIKG